LIEEIKEQAPNLVILVLSSHLFHLHLNNQFSLKIGPFLNPDNPKVKSCTLEQEFEDIFKEQVVQKVKKSLKFKTSFPAFLFLFFSLFCSFSLLAGVFIQIFNNFAGSLSKGRKSSFCFSSGS
jgi:hypothetical protein